MKMEKHNFLRIATTDTEKVALKIVSDMLLQVQTDFSDYIALESQHTGEIIRVDEIGRVRGVLGFFEEPNQIAEVRINREKNTQ